MLKCALCGQNHAANYSKCEKRIEFIERQQNYRNRTQRRNTNPPQFRPAPQLASFNFPAINGNNNNNAAWSNSSNRTLQDPTTTNAQLFSPSELMEIFKEMMTAMSQAKSKLDQITALGQIVIKYSP
jgi:hypothetical protein